MEGRRNLWTYQVRSIQILKGKSVFPIRKSELIKNGNELPYEEDDLRDSKCAFAFRVCFFISPIVFIYSFR